ncbi:unnamed protein product [Phytophthora fragariaefolia]|uniref:Unnamed protein product n=1 Tax=Phytophthora fragariaefolia TaxID=1490495 RepID=A0A9W7CSK6_9STRA|nr:unnamed protein product [Phytophthora fragariaefolia]
MLLLLSASVAVFVEIVVAFRIRAAVDKSVAADNNNNMEEAVTRQHAHPNTVYHYLYDYSHLGYSKSELTHIYSKCEKTIGNWIKVYGETGTFQRANTAADKKFTETPRQWLYDYYQTKPLAYLDEAEADFKRYFNLAISNTTVWRIIHDYGLTWKVLECRAMHIKEHDIFRFAEELSKSDWNHQNLVFLDEVAFDNRSMIRKRGYSLKGRKLAVRGDFQRKPRTSLLTFIGDNGVIDYYNTERTFDRVEFTKCCRDFAYSKLGNVRQYPGPNSVWILDGASIHRHPEIVQFLRSIGVVMIFLPAYCQFYNPIEYFFVTRGNWKFSRVASSQLPRAQSRGISNGGLDSE